jgi:hypothetical protein
MLKVVMAKGKKLKKGRGDLEVHKQNVVSLKHTIIEQNVVSLKHTIIEQNVVSLKHTIIEQNAISSN